MKQSEIHFSLHLQYPCVSGSTVTFPCFMVAGSSIVTLALELAALAVAPRLAELLAAPSLVPVCTDAGSCDGVAEGFILTLAAVAAVGSPVLAIATWKTHSRWPRWLGKRSASSSSQPLSLQRAGRGMLTLVTFSRTLSLLNPPSAPAMCFGMHGDNSTS